MFPAIPHDSCNELSVSLACCDEVELTVKRSADITTEDSTVAVNAGEKTLDRMAVNDMNLAAYRAWAAGRRLRWFKAGGMPSPSSFAVAVR
jgi:hypothetical protein